MSFMWQPHTEAEARSGIENGLARESASFDAKLSLPAAGRNKDMAKDICAMTVDGGALLFGLGGDDPTRPDQLVPFDLAGAAERIDQVAQSAIAEPPVIEIYDIPSDDQPGLGYLCVVVPASPRAPHMLTIDGDNRYWGRGPTGNRILTEGEVARLYERRARWETDRGHMLAEAVNAMPFTFDIGQVGPMVTVVKPVAPGRPLLRVAAGGDQIGDFLPHQLAATARQADPYPDQGTSGIDDAFAISRSGADVWVMMSNHGADPSFPYQARVSLGSDGSLTYWHSPVLNTTQQGRLLVMERSITRAVSQAFATAAFVYDRAGFHGAVDLGVAVLGIELASGASVAQAFTPATYGAPDYRHDERVTMQELSSQRDGVVRRMLAPLFEVISVRGYDPFGDRR